MDMDGHRSSGTGTGVCEIEEVDENSNERQLHDDDDDDDEEYCVYVAVGKSDTSMDALSWALNNFVAQSPSTIIYLIHVFPQINHIPNPLGIGMIPRNQVSAEQVESYIDQERGKRRELLQKFLQSCSTSKIKQQNYSEQVKVDTILIESDSVAKAILDLIPILQIKRLVIGANKLHLRKSKSRRGKGIADQILQNAPQSCKVRIICEKKEVNEQMMSLSPFPQPLATCTSANDASITSKKEDHQNDLVSCICFIPKFK
ncbi:hypothetical protein JHK87_045875 [Glycine soja]|nr:hypothetical protein JHK87_045875 [Glycine soja]